MTRWLRVCRVGLLALLLSSSALAIDPIELSDPALQERYRDLTHELRCMQCQTQSIADSPVGLAGDLRREVRELLESGKTDAEIREHLRARYGDFILFRPVFNWRNAWLWAAPVILLLLGLAVAVRVLRQRARLAATDTTSPDDPAP
ncbi:MAG: cytochrome c-type biogenesis protein CcmH [Nevskiaceae bacterium]